MPKDLTLIKNKIFSYWTKYGFGTADKNFAKMIGIHFEDLQGFLVEFLGGREKYIEILSNEIVKKKYHILDGGYDFVFSPTSVEWFDDDAIYIDGYVAGTVQLIMTDDTKIYELHKLWSSNLSQWTQDEINTEISEVIYDEIYPKIKKYLPTIHYIDFELVKKV